MIIILLEKNLFLFKTNHTNRTNYHNSKKTQHQKTFTLPNQIMPPSKVDGICNDFKRAIFNPPHHPPDRKILRSRIRAHISRIQYILWNIIFVILLYLIPDSTLNHNETHRSFFHFFQCLSIFFYFLTSLSDPGYVALLDTNSDPNDDILSDPFDQTEIITIDLNEETPSNFCASCRFIRPLRSKHCYDCGKCIIKYDHHCPMIGNCIGGKNHKYFILFIITQSIVINWSFYISWYTFLNSLLSFQFSLYLWMIRFLAVIVVSVPFMMVIGLSGYHCYLSASNQTSNEIAMKWVAKQKETGTVCESEVNTSGNVGWGLFDRGVVENMKGFWFGELDKEWVMANGCILRDGDCEQHEFDESD